MVMIMNIVEAKKIEREYYDKEHPSEDDFFLYTEAMDYIIHKTADSDTMMNLGGIYYERKEFDLALKYYEMAAEYQNGDAYECLGYIWYYGRTGIKDYQKAFEYFKKGAEAGRIISAYKMADMYKNGYYVKQDEEKYNEIIEALYPKARKLTHLNEPLPEIFTRLASIRVKQNRQEEAIQLLEQAKDFLAQRLKYHRFFGDLTIMKYLIRDLYQLREMDEELFDLYDLYALCRKPVKITFCYENQKYILECVEEDGYCVVHFDHHWYRSIDEFFQKAYLMNRPITSYYYDLYAFEVHV